jgi:hypothetical protein
LTREKKQNITGNKMRLDTQPNPTLERTYTERRLTQLWCKMQDTPPDSPMTVQAIPWHSMQTQKNDGVLLPFLMSTWISGTNKRFEGFAISHCLLLFSFMFLHALEEMIPPLFTRLFPFLFSLVARDVWPQEVLVICWNTST